jgi:hypothetical protein
MRPFRRPPFGPRRMRPHPPRPGLFRPVGSSPAVEAARQELIRANHLVDSGQHAEAGEVFARISTLAEQAGFPGRATHLAARAAHSFLEADDSENAMSYARRVMRLSISMGNVQQTIGLARRIVAELDAHGYTDLAEAFRKEVNQYLGKLGLSLTDISAGEPGLSEQRGQLPSQCPACLGPVRSNEVTWIDQRSATCAYCGSTLQAQ